MKCVMGADIAVEEAIGKDVRLQAEDFSASIALPPQRPKPVIID
jgi:hypothetical protein